MKPRIELFPETQLIGMHINMTLAKNQTPKLWAMFMPRRKEIEGRIGLSLYAIKQMNAGTSVENFTPHTAFESWATVPVETTVNVPDGMDTLTIPQGQYAVFVHHGPADSFSKTWGHIMETWLPTSPYEWDDRPQFEILQEGYRPDDPNAQEEVWIPIR